MIFNESIYVKGEIFLKAWKKGKFLFEAHQGNMIVTNGLFTLANLLIGAKDATNQANFTPAKIGFGDSSVASTINLTGLQGGNCRIESSASDISPILDTANTTTYGNNQVRFFFNLSYNDNIANQVFGVAPSYTGTTWTPGVPYTIKEFAIFTRNNTMFNRIAWTGIDLYMDTDIAINGYFVVTLSQTGV